MPAGSDAAAYAEALKDEKTITLDFGGYTAGPDNPSTQVYVKWAEHVTEMSGGKIKFKHDFAGAKVPIHKMADGLKQGRIDLGLYASTLQAEEFPLTDAFAGMSGFEYPNPVSGVLARFAARAELAQRFEPFQEEATKHGIVGLYPLYGPSTMAMNCNTGTAPQSLDDLKGKRLRISSPLHHELAERLGMVPVSVNVTELFAALQRGVVDCSISSLGSVVTLGQHDVTDTWTFGQGPGHEWVESPTGWGFSQKAWDKLPLAARQLIWDTQTELLEGQLKNSLTSSRSVMEVTKKKGFDFGTYGSDVTAVMEKYYGEREKKAAEELEKLGVTDDGKAAVAQYREMTEKWWKIVTEELDYPADSTWADLPDEFSADMSEVDLKPFLDRFFKEVLSEGRPS